MPDTDLIDATEALALLGIDKSTLHRWVTAGRLTPVKRGPTYTLFRRGDVLAQVPAEAAEQSA